MRRGYCGSFGRLRHSLPGSVSVSNTSIPQPWYVLQVQPLRESLTERLLIQKGYEAYMPTRLPAPDSRGRMKRVFPLFPGYLFCRIDMGNHEACVVTTPGVVRILGHGGHPVSVPEVQIADVRRVSASGLSLSTNSEPVDGCAAMIVCGCLRGICGTVVDRGDRHKLAVRVDLVECSLMVSIERSWAVPLCSDCRQRSGCGRQRPYRAA